MRTESAPCNHPGTQGDKGCGVFNTWLLDCSGAKVAHGRFSSVSHGSDSLPSLPLTSHCPKFSYMAALSYKGGWRMFEKKEKRGFDEQPESLSHLEPAHVL